MRAGWYWRPDIAGVMRVFEDTGEYPDHSALYRKGYVWVAVFARTTGGSADWTYLHRDSDEIRASEPITQTHALAQLAGLGIDTAMLNEREMLLDGEGFSDLDVPPLELAKQRINTWGADPNTQLWACVDFDYLKKSDRQGARQFQRPRERPVQAWVLRRGAALIAAVRPDTGSFCVIAQEQFDGTTTARKFLEVAAQVHRVLGHNLLNGDYQAIGQLVELSDELIGKTVDTQDILLRVEFARRPRIRSSRGLGLSELLRLNTGHLRSKAAGETTIWGMPVDTTPVRWKEDPIHDCQETVALWSALVAAGRVVTGRSQPESLPFDRVAIAQLQGEIPCITGRQWRAERRGEPPSGHRGVVKHHSTNQLTAALTTPISDKTLVQLQRVHWRLSAHALICESSTTDRLISAVQYMSPKLNSQLRTQIGDLCDELIEQYAVALWELTHRKEAEASVAIWQQGQEHPVPAMVWPFVQECLREHRAGARRAAHGGTPAIPSHYSDALHYFTSHTDTAALRKWLLQLHTHPAFTAWRYNSAAYRELSETPGYQQLCRLWT